MSDDTQVLATLYDALDQDPTSIVVHEMLLDVFQARGDQEATAVIAAALVEIDPSNQAARRYLNVRNRAAPEPRLPSSEGVNIGASEPVEESGLSVEQTLEKGYPALKLGAGLLREEIEAVRALGGVFVDGDEAMTNLQWIMMGNVNTAVPAPQPLSVREAARSIMKTPGRAHELLVEDFESVVRWAMCQQPVMTTDAIREWLAKRKLLLEAALPESTGRFLISAFTHIERSRLQKSYVNSVTMIGGDSLDTIPESNFFVSEDNYAWDMSELSQAISSNDGVMRNPLSRELFTEADIRAILAHPLGKRLKPLHMEQSQLRRGVRPATVAQIDKLGRLLLTDQSIDSAPSRKAMDEFLAYVATLPDSEQKTINSLKISATDKATGQPYDYTIGDSVMDGKANTTCLHKVGDFLSQASRHFR